MCNNTALQQKIRKHTDNGDLIAQFLADTVRGAYPDAKYHHKLEATKHLIRFGFTDEEQSNFWGLIPTPERTSSREKSSFPRRRESRGAGRGGRKSYPSCTSC